MRKGCDSTAMVQGTSLPTVVLLKVVKNVMADNTHQSVIGIPKGAVIYPVVVLDVQCRWHKMLSITGHRGRSSLFNRLGKQLSRMAHKGIDMMMCSTNQKIYQCDVFFFKHHERF